MGRAGMLVLMMFALSEGVGAELSEQLIEECASTRRIDPFLMYAVSLVESARGYRKGYVRPWPWTLRTPDGPMRFDTREQAQEYLAEAIARFKPYQIDVGAFQVNVHWHGKRFEEPAQMLDPVVNCEVAAEILAEAMASAPKDPVIGVGRYHTWADEPRARRYGERVIRIAANVRRIAMR